MDGGVDGVVAEFCNRWVVGDGCKCCRVNAGGRGRVFRRSHGVELDGENVDDVGGVVVVVRKVDVNIEADVVLGVALVDAGDVVVFDCH